MRFLPATVQWAVAKPKQMYVRQCAHWIKSPLKKFESAARREKSGEWGRTKVERKRINMGVISMFNKFASSLNNIMVHIFLDSLFSRLKLFFSTWILFYSFSFTEKISFSYIEQIFFFLLPRRFSFCFSVSRSLMRFVNTLPNSMAIWLARRINITSNE